MENRLVARDEVRWNGEGPLSWRGVYWRGRGSVGSGIYFEEQLERSPGYAPHFCLPPNRETSTYFFRFYYNAAYPRVPWGARSPAEGYVSCLATVFNRACDSFTLGLSIPAGGGSVVQ